MTPRFSADELNAAFAQFQKTTAEVAEHRDWDVWADQFTEDATYIEHAFGTMRGREEIRVWIKKTMNAFPGSHMTGYPSLWHVVDPETARVICEVDNPMRDPGDGSQFGATNMTILTYAGNGLWSCEEDIYNPMRFMSVTSKWCQRASELGTIDDQARAWMETTGAMFATRKK